MEPREVGCAAVCAVRPLPTLAELQALRALEHRYAMRVTCPHCLARVESLAAHTADTGDLGVRPEWACPELWTRRNGRRGRP